MDHFSDNYLIPKAGGGGEGMMSYLTPMGILGVNSIVSKWIGYVVDVDLFMDHGRSLYLFRYLLYSLNEYNIIKVWTYIETEELIRKWLHTFHVRDKREEYLFLRKEQYEGIIGKLWFENDPSILYKTSSSELLFIILKNAVISDVTLKRQCGMLLNFCIHVEQREYEMIQRDVNQYIGERSALRYFSFDSESLEKFIGETMKKIQKNENIEIVWGDQKQYQISPWIFVCIFLRLMEAKSKIFAEIKNSNRELFENGLDLYDEHDLVSESKRYSEVAFRCCILKCLLPDIHDYEMKCVIKDKPTMTVLYSLPQIMKWGCSVDKFSIVDENIEQQIHKFIFYLKEEGKVALKENPLLDSIIRDTGGSGRKNLNKIANSIMNDALKNIKGNIYGEFLSPKQVAKTTIPLFISLFLENEILSAYSGGYGFTKFILYSLFPLIWSGVYDAQVNFMSLFNFNYQSLDHH